jgi:Phenazine biosynthesis-like protein
MEFQHVDVFADTPYAGNSVTVFLIEGTVATGQMLAITQEFRHFESIFLWPAADDSRWRARVFDLEGELDFAGHPVLGAAAARHDRAGGDTTRRWNGGGISGPGRPGRAEPAVHPSPGPLYRPVQPDPGRTSRFGRRHSPGTRRRPGRPSRGGHPAEPAPGDPVTIPIYGAGELRQAVRSRELGLLKG